MAMIKTSIRSMLLGLFVVSLTTPAHARCFYSSFAKADQESDLCWEENGFSGVFSVAYHYTIGDERRERTLVLVVPRDDYKRLAKALACSGDQLVFEVEGRLNLRVRLYADSEASFVEGEVVSSGQRVVVVEEQRQQQRPKPYATSEM